MLKSKGKGSRGEEDVIKIKVRMGMTPEAMDNEVQRGSGQGSRLMNYKQKVEVLQLQHCMKAMLYLPCIRR